MEKITQKVRLPKRHDSTVVRLRCDESCAALVLERALKGLDFSAAPMVLIDLTFLDRYHLELGYLLLDHLNRNQNHMGRMGLLVKSGVAAALELIGLHTVISVICTDAPQRAAA